VARSDQGHKLWLSAHLRAARGERGRLHRARLGAGKSRHEQRQRRVYQASDGLRSLYAEVSDGEGLAADGDRERLHLRLHRDRRLEVRRREYRAARPRRRQQDQLLGAKAADGGRGDTAG